MKTYRLLIALLGVLFAHASGAVPVRQLAAQSENWVVSGTVVYYGAATPPVDIEIGVHEALNDPPVATTYVALPGGLYSFSDAPDNSNIYLSAFLDVNDSGGPPDAGDAVGWYDGNHDGAPDLLTVSSDLAGLDIALGDLIYVDAAAGGNADGSAWVHAYTDLQAALSAAASGSEIWIAAGTYKPTAGADRSVAFQLKDGVRVFGGFGGAETLRHDRNWTTHPAILSGDIGTAGTATDNSYNVVNGSGVTRSAVLDGVVITGGHADGSGVNDKGGGLYVGNGSPSVANVRFHDNYALNHGGGMVSEFSNSQPLVFNCVFSGNSTEWNGGGLSNLWSANATVINSTIVGNSGSNGGGIVNLEGGQATVINTLIWGNAGAEIGLQSGATIAVSYSLVEGGYTGTGNVDGDPFFKDADGPDDTMGTLDDDFRLQLRSEAIDRGSNDALPADIFDLDGDFDTGENTPVDLVGGLRQIDIGAAVDNGSGSPPLVDIGACEAYNALLLPMTVLRP